MLGGLARCVGVEELKLLISNVVVCRGWGFDNAKPNSGLFVHDGRWRKGLVLPYRFVLPGS